MTASTGMPGTTETPAETPDTYHDHDAALKWALRLENAAWLPLILAIFALIVLVAELYVYMPQIVQAGAFEAYLSVSIPVLIPLTAAVLGVSLFMLLRASGSLLLLLDIQEK